MDANSYEQRVRETAAAMGYDARTVDRMFSAETNARVAARDARIDQQGRHQEARRLALAHVAREQEGALPGAAQDYEDAFAAHARAMGYSEDAIKAMAALPTGGGRVSEARLQDLTHRYAEALRVQEQAGGAGQTGEHGRPFEVRDPELDPEYRDHLGRARMVDQIQGGDENERTVRRLWECKEGLRHLQAMQPTEAELTAEVMAELGLADGGDGAQRVQEAVSLQATDAGEQAWEVVLCQAGPTKTGGRRYPAETLKRAVDARLYDGAKMYLNHVSERELQSKPHRDVREWAATVRPGSVRFDPVTGSVIGTAVVHNETAAAILASPTARAGIGLSADLTAKWAKAGDGLTDATAITAIHSVDFVPEGNAVHGRAVIGPAQ